MVGHRHRKTEAVVVALLPSAAMLATTIKSGGNVKVVPPVTGWVAAMSLHPVHRNAPVKQRLEKRRKRVV